MRYNLSYSEARVLKFGKCMQRKVQKVHRKQNFEFFSKLMNLIDWYQLFNHVGKIGEYFIPIKICMPSILAPLILHPSWSLCTLFNCNSPLFHLLVVYFIISLWCFYIHNVQITFELWHSLNRVLNVFIVSLQYP